jgi:hypothetical protein
MNKKEIIRYLQSIIAIPMFAIAMPLSGLAIPSMTATGDNLTEETSVITPQEEIARKEIADKIDSYFESKGLPLSGYGQKFVEEAVKNEIDPYLLPAIAMRESTGGKQACKKATYSVFGWGSCKINFESIDKSIEIVAMNLGGNNPKTDHHYEGKTTEQILRKYNSYIANYPAQVIKIMESIKNTEIKK